MTHAAVSGALAHGASSNSLVSHLPVAGRIGHFGAERAVLVLDLRATLFNLRGFDLQFPVHP